ncbi:putative amidoligase enzyme-domain-containing protein [Triangularia verruculosa]|uniref:Amidoligase enzyme-domain-containing protein n=1 Tax=Triangularia verruculosa TaxID=2587418 RepID=A0AAN7APW4_9PEZI|nr:putative amidoligase enzyme-domain-containing protein [Triangularia verruculosa]
MLSSLDFGVEIELLIAPYKPEPTFADVLAKNGWDSNVGSQLRPKATAGTYRDMEFRQAQNRKALREAIAAALKEDGIETNTAITSDYEAWSVVDEPALGELPGYWRMEFVSKILSSGKDWHTELTRLFAILKRNCRIRLTHGCSMHVHVSPGPSTFNNSQLRSICKAICYFDDAITRVMPADRKENTWARSNFMPERPVKGDTSSSNQSVNPKIKRYYSLVQTQSFSQLWKYFDKVTSNQVHSFMANTAGNNSRYLSWNFENITQQCGTLEFRRPPAADTAEKANHWIAFALGFVAQAIAADWKAVESQKRGGGVAELRAHVVRGLQGLKMLPNCFASLGPISEDSSKPLVLSPEQLLEMEELQRAKSKTSSPFASKANSRANTPNSSANSTPSVGRSDSGGWGRR